MENFNAYNSSSQYIRMQKYNFSQNISIKKCFPNILYKLIDIRHSFILKNCFPPQDLCRVNEAFTLIGRTILFVGDCYLDRAAPLSNCFVAAAASATTTHQQDTTPSIQRPRRPASADSRRHHHHHHHNHHRAANTKRSLSSQRCASDRQGTLRRTFYALPDLGGIRRLFL